MASRRWWWVPAGLAAVVAGAWFGVPRVIGDIFQWMGLPTAGIGRAVHGVFEGVAGPFLRPYRLDQRVAELERDVSVQAVDRARLADLERENVELRGLARFATGTSATVLGARVVARETDFQRVRIRLDRGARDGVEPGLALVNGQGALVGTVSAVSPRTSVAWLLSDTQSRVSAAKVGGSVLIGVLAGKGDRLAQLELVPNGLGIAEGDTVVTGGLEAQIPANLPLGRIRRVDGRPSDAFVTAVVEPFGEAVRVDDVGILIPPR